MQEEPQIDQNALSRQLAVYGHQAQGKLMTLRVFIHGMTGVAVQVAKNLILAGPKQVTIFDKNPVTPLDIGRNFYLNQSHIGKVARANASIPELKNLNTNVQVDIADKDDIQFIVQNYTCVIVHDNYNRQYVSALNKACREKNIGFLLAGNLGLYGYTFVDFGQNHKIFDATGEQPKSIHIAGISQQEVATVYLHDEKRHGLNDNDTITFREVKGMTEINGKQFKITVKSPHSFTIGDTSKFSLYTSGGIASEVKVAQTTKFNSLQKSFRYPYPPESKEMPICSWEKFGNPEQLHVILNGMFDFWAKNNRLPKLLNEQDAKELLTLSKQWQNSKIDSEGEQFKVDQLDEKLVRNVSFYADTQISPCCSFWGGIITQQIVKLTGKYTPLKQWLHHQFFEVLPEQQVKRTINNDRYADYHALFGDEFVQKAQKSSSFLIGAGALGCEFIKMFALMGLSTQGNGSIKCTDDDNIEISNLNRQFLFRKQHVGKNKSQTACEVGRTINSSSKFQSIKLKVAPDTEDYFNDQFWTGIDFIVNAVDNIKARQYVDNQCVWYEKPLFESGTLGTKCHSQIIIPHHTQSYNDIMDPPQETIPLCTLKNFPYQIQHTIQWARDYFEGMVAEPSQELKRFYENKKQYLDTLIKQNKQNPTIARYKLETLKKMYKANEARSYEACIQLSVNIFWDVFHNQIAQLLNAFPEDHIIQQTGKPFWGGLKRTPKAIPLDMNDDLQIQVIQAAANIFAVVFNLKMENDKGYVKSIAKNIQPVKFAPKKIKIETDEKAKKDQPVEINEQDEVEIQNMYNELINAPTDPKNSPTIVEFEKDDPANFHIEFMGGVSNLRARNYKIDQVDNFKVKLIAGKIIPAIATTTAMVVGAVGIQIIKYLLNKGPQVYKNVTINLALPLWVFNDPLPPIEITDKEFDPIMCGPIRAIPGKFTKWQKINIKGPMTLQQLKTHFEKTYNIEVSMITYGTSTIYSSYGLQSKKRFPLRIQKVVQEVTKKQLPKWRTILALGVSGNVQDGTDCIMPDIKYFI